MSHKTRTVFEGRVVGLNIESLILPNGEQQELEIIRHPGGAAVVALDEDQHVCLLRQFRHAAGGWLWELPAGKLEKEEAAQATASIKPTQYMVNRLLYWKEFFCYGIVEYLKIRVFTTFKI